MNKDFWDRVDVRSKDECWNFKGAKSKGYGYLMYRGRRNQRAHRIAFEITYGTKPECVCHSCDNPSCCNPHHLFAGNHKLNALDREMKGRGIGRFRRGQAHPLSKISDATANKIRETYARGGKTMRDVSKAYGLSPAQVCRIINGTRRNKAQ